MRWRSYNFKRQKHWILDYKYGIYPFVLSLVIRAFRNQCVVENAHGYWTTYGF